MKTKAEVLKFVTEVTAVRAIEAKAEAVFFAYAATAAGFPVPVPLAAYFPEVVA